MIIIFSETGKTPRLLAKYRPVAPVLVVTSNATLAKSCSALYAMNVSDHHSLPEEFLQYLWQFAQLCASSLALYMSLCTLTQLLQDKGMKAMLQDDWS